MLKSGDFMDINKIRQDFPILNRKINGKPLIYFDNAASTQKPKQVLDAVRNYYENHNANIHRGVHTLSEEASDMYDEAHKKVGKFINAKHPLQEIIFDFFNPLPFLTFSKKGVTMLFHLVQVPASFCSKTTKALDAETIFLTYNINLRTLTLSRAVSSRCKVL